MNSNDKDALLKLFDEAVSRSYYYGKAYNNQNISVLDAAGEAQLIAIHNFYEKLNSIPTTKK